MAKKSSEKKAEKIIVPEKYFVLCKGVVLKDIKELADSLDHISDDEFICHVNAEKNDFANWIRDVFEEKELAEQLFAIKDKKDMQIMLLRYLLAKNG